MKKLLSEAKPRGSSGRNSLTNVMVVVELTISVVVLMGLLMVEVGVTESDAPMQGCFLEKQASNDGDTITQEASTILTL